MPDILLDFPIAAPRALVFDAVSTPAGLDQWWTQSSVGAPAKGAEYQLFFSPDFEWRARVVRCVPNEEFELEMAKSDGDWDGTRVGFRLTGDAGVTQVHFHHTGWPEPNAHYRTSSMCWAQYLRILRRYIEHGETVPYEQRLDV